MLIGSKRVIWKKKNKNALCVAENANMYLFQMIQILIGSVQNPVGNLITRKLFKISLTKDDRYSILELVKTSSLY